MGYTVYAIEGSSNYPDIVASLREGEGCFGFSSVATADLHALKARVEKEVWPSLSAEEKASYYIFLLDLKEDDYVVYVDIPEWGQCVVAKVIGGYYWRFGDADFNHRFPVDNQSVFVFDRNGRAVHPSLSSRLRMQRVWWRIALKLEFEELLSTLRGGEPKELPLEARRVREIQPILVGITQTIHHTYAGKSREELCAEVIGHLSRYPEASMGLLISTADSSTPALDAAPVKLRHESGKQVALLIGEDIAAFLLQHGKVS